MFVTLRELREEVGNDAARFFYLMRKADQHMDFDLDLAKSHSQENPVYYVQYAHARICSVFAAVTTRGRVFTPAAGLAALDKLTTVAESELLRLLFYYPFNLERAALQYEPHRLVQYLREVAQAFHGYYNAHHFISDDEALTQARLLLVRATQQILANGLSLLGMRAVEQM